MNEIFQVPGAIIKVTTMTHGLRLIVDTQENLSEESKSRLFQLHNKLGWFTFNVNQIEAENIVDLPPLKTDATKTPAQRMRAVLYRIWEQDNGDFDTFDNFYTHRMEQIIEKLKEKLT